MCIYCKITNFIIYYLLYPYFLLPLQKIVKPTLKPKNYINETYHTADCYADDVVSWLFPKP